MSTIKEEFKGIYVVALIAVLPLMLLKAYVLLRIYQWFIPSDWPQMTYPAAVGVVMMVTMFGRVSGVSKEITYRHIITAFSATLLNLGFAGIVRYFV